tara:strand:- start:71 stop:316 length:246 start_codon:yes stop_codon:yes gene_type:complete
MKIQAWITKLVRKINGIDRYYRYEQNIMAAYDALQRAQKYAPVYSFKTGKWTINGFTPEEICNNPSIVQHDSPDKVGAHRL